MPDTRSEEVRAIQERARALRRINNQRNPFGSSPATNVRNANRIMRAERRMLDAVSNSANQKASTASKGNNGG